MGSFFNKVRIGLREYRKELRESLTIMSMPSKHRKALKRLRGKETINCLFMVVFEEVWKYDELYRLMSGNKRLNPTILVCPVVNYGKENMLSRMNRCFEKMKEKGFRVVRAYDEASDSYLDLRELHPDILFFTNPYKDLVDSRYHIDGLTDILSIYIPYMFGNNRDDHFHNLLLHNLVWRFYAESEIHKKYSEESSRCRGRNVVVSGYPGIEGFLDSTLVSSNHHYWKNSDRHLKRIIWAPHHSIVPNNWKVSYSCFLEYADYMLEIARRYAEKVQFVFKPHPLLRNKLDKRWGKKKTDDYYNLWNEMDNTSLSEGEYTDLFKQSDAMIHDCGSFTVEYLYLNKPVMRTLNGENLEEMFNSFGMQCIEQHYLAKTREDIEQFIRNVIAGVDPMKKQRTEFVNKVLMPKGSPSQNIIDDILDSIDNQVLYRN